MARLTDEGVLYRRGLLGPEALLRFDDIAEVVGDRARGPGGEVRLGAALADQVRAALAPLAPAGGLAEVGAALQARLDAPCGARWAAQALLEAATRLGASDLHLEPDGRGAQARVRLEGELLPLCRLGPKVLGRAGAALKGLAGCLPYRADVVQEGRVARAGVAADVRASFVPTALGERVALRLFGRLYRLGELGLEPELLAGLEALLAARSGLLLVAGATGAGKTTTLYALLAHLCERRPGAHLSLEDPVEQRLRLAGIPVDQVELSPERGLDGEAALAAALRQDVDVLAVGEVRTPAEARLAVRAAQTGRLVLAGVHAGSGEEARRRLLDLGADPTLLGGTLLAALHQSLAAGPCGCASGCEGCRGAGRRRRPQARLTRFGAAAVREEVAA